MPTHTYHIANLTSIQSLQKLHLRNGSLGFNKPVMQFLVCTNLLRLFQLSSQDRKLAWIGLDSL